MPPNILSQSHTKFYLQDVVRKIAGPPTVGVIVRTWHDSEDEPMPEPEDDPLMRHLSNDEFLVNFLTGPDTREIITGSNLVLQDRTLSPGEFCKRKLDDFQSGVVTNVKVKGRLEHAISGQAVGWKMSDDPEIAPKCHASPGDYVCFNDWVGQVIEVFEENIFEDSNHQLVCAPELGGNFVVGEKGTNLINHPTYQGVISYLLRGGAPIDTVIAIKPTVYAIVWLAINQSLTIEDSQTRTRPPRFWSEEEISQLTLLPCWADPFRIGDVITLKQSANIPFTTHGKRDSPDASIDVYEYKVLETETYLDILWQDCSTTETVRAIDVIPYTNTDEHDCWPGDHVRWRYEGVERHAIVQSVNAAERTASVLFTDSGTIEVTSVLDLDPHGVTDNPQIVETSQEELGVRRGDLVCIHRNGTTNGCDSPRVPKIGELEQWVQEPLLSPNGIVSGWRREMITIGTSISKPRQNVLGSEYAMQRPSSDDTLSWLGEVIDLRLDGTIVILHPNGSFEEYPLERLTKIDDAVEMLEDDLLDQVSGPASDEDSEMWSINEDGVWHHHEAIIDDQGWEDYSESDAFNNVEMEEMDEISDTCTPGVLSPSTVSNPITPSETPADSLSNLPNFNDQPMPSTSNASLSWKRFDILTSAPPDHAYHASIPAPRSRAFMSRLTREYRILESSLPDTILVRTYEDRSDLMRCLILGPGKTPYQDAPFIIDWMLDANFPNSPPLAHFLSWTNGNGRVNPNLYEEGKVCLSILGTWHGDRNESWNPAGSSLLQAFVSIQGLVLVREPWFCEPAYEPLRGTDEGIVNSRLYSEKAYILSRGFVRRALEVPPGGFENEINWLYHTHGLLGKIVNDTQQLIESSRSSKSGDEPDFDDGIPKLTAGGILSLERTLVKLKEILNTGKQ